MASGVFDSALYSNKHSGCSSDIFIDTPERIPDIIKALHLFICPIFQGIGTFGSTPFQQDKISQADAHRHKLRGIARILNDAFPLTFINKAHKSV